MSKITLKEFLESNEIMVIHCDTEKKADKLLKAFGESHWNLQNKFDNNNYWNIYKSDTCYSNKNSYTNLSCYANEVIKIYEFEDVIFEEEKYEIWLLGENEDGSANDYKQLIATCYNRVIAVRLFDLIFDDFNKKEDRLLSCYSKLTLDHSKTPRANLVLRNENVEIIEELYLEG